MTSTRKTVPALLALASAALAGLPAAHAADEAPATSAPPEKAAVEKAAPEKAAPEKDVADTVERLPASAFPEWKVRGLHGGSLWLSGSMHGMPWPYTPRTGVGVSGSVWLDTGYETIRRGNNTEPDTKFLLNQGRAVLRVSPTFSTDAFYVQGQAELVANKDQSSPQPAVADVDDLWLRVGKWKTWDLQVGRFEAFEVTHFGMGLDLNTLERQGASDQQRPPPDVYGLQSIVYRQSGVGNVAFHYYLSDFLRLELLGQFGFDSVAAINTWGGRPAVVLDLGVLKAKLAVDARQQFPVNSSSKESRFQRGATAAVQVVLDPFVELGINVTYGLVDHYNPQNVTDPNASMGDFDGAGSVSTWSVGGFANARVVDGVLFGAGANFTSEDDQVSGHFTNLQSFGALQWLVRKQLFVKLVGAYAKAHIAQGGKEAWDNDMLSARVRLMYLF
jgi:hypothetical protein